MRRQELSLSPQIYVIAVKWPGCLAGLRRLRDRIVLPPVNWSIALRSTDQSQLARFLHRLELRSALTSMERDAILGLGGQTHRFPARVDVVSPGEKVDTACLVADGLAARFDQMRDGERQLTSFYIPGDMCDLHSVVFPKAAWSITAISPLVVQRVPHGQLRDLCIQFPAIAIAFWRDGTVDTSIFAKWVGNLGRKNAKSRIAHIFCEMGVRTQAAELGSKTSYRLPVTQEQLGDATGLTSVHVNRTLQEIRGEGLLTFGAGQVEIHDWAMLAAVADFDPAYLMLAEPPQRIAPEVRGGERMAAG